MSPKAVKRIRLLAALAGLFLLAALAGAGWFYSRLRASLPRLDGAQRISGLAALVTIERDALGVPTIRATTREDIARSLGYLHAQDRFFQMDLLRRRGAGELAEILGPAVVQADRTARRFGFRALAQGLVARMDARDRAVAGRPDRHGQSVIGCEAHRGRHVGLLAGADRHVGGGNGGQVKSGAGRAETGGARLMDPAGQGVVEGGEAAGHGSPVNVGAARAAGGQTIRLAGDGVEDRHLDPGPGGHPGCLGLVVYRPGELGLSGGSGAVQSSSSPHPCRARVTASAAACGHRVVQIWGECGRGAQQS